MKQRGLLAALLVLVPTLASAQQLSRNHWREIDKTLSPAGFLRAPIYITAGLPACGSTNAGAFAFDDTLNLWTFCDGTGWVYNSISWPLLAPDGSATAPSYSFLNATSSGMYLDPAGVVSLGIKGKDGSGVDAGGGNVLLIGGRGTGVGAGGFAGMQIGVPGTTSGSGLNALQTWLNMVASNGVFTLGNLSLNTAPGQSVVRATAVADGVLTDTAGGGLLIESGRGSGAGAASSMAFLTPTVGVSGTAQQGSATRFTIGSVTSIFTTHVAETSTAPTVSACGTTPSGVTGSDHAGRLTTGSGATVQSCTITFSVAFSATPVCVANDETQILILRAVPSATALVIDCAVAGCLESDVITYICRQGA